jgi:hypothetical protein
MTVGTHLRNRVSCSRTWHRCMINSRGLWRLEPAGRSAQNDIEAPGVGQGGAHVTVKAQRMVETFPESDRGARVDTRGAPGRTGPRGSPGEWIG